MRRLTLLLLAALALSALTAPAYAAESAAASAPAPAPAAKAVQGTPVEPSVVDVQLWPQDVASGMTLVVVAVVPTSSPLPAAVSIPLPDGASVTWAGEIFENQSQDIQRQPVVAADKRSVTISAARSRTVQYEAQYKPYVDKGGRRYAQLDWVQTKPAARTHFAFRLPTSSDDVKSQPAYVGVPDMNGTGEKLYTLGDKKLAVGEKYTLKVDYTAGKVGTLPPVESTTPDLLLPILFGLLAVALGLLTALVLRQRQSRGTPE